MRPRWCFLHRCLCLHGLAERETLVDLNAEGAGLNQGVEPVERLPIGRAAVVDGNDAVSGPRLWLYAVRIG